MRGVVVMIVLSMLLAGCDNSRVYEDSRDMKDRAWMVSDTAQFDFSINEPGKRYNIYYNIRNSVDYPYARLFVQYVLTDSLGGELQQKLVSDFLFDQKTGKPAGSSSLGDIYDHRFLLLKNYEFPRAGMYTVGLQQFMRKDTLPGILSVGVRVEVAQ